IRYLKSKNKILYQYDGGNGVKTGYTKAAGKCLVAGAKRDGMQLIAVVLNDYDMFNDCKKLLDYGFANYKWTDVTGNKYFENKVKIINGLEGTADVEQMEDIYLPLSKEDSKIEKKYEIYEGINAPVEKGARVGTAKYILNGEVVKKVPLYLAQSVEENTWSYWLGRILQDWLGTKGKELRVT
ncbi:MAG: D-alanyl-D-alanine carboxypeptidase family protein, partial [Lachnospiraceae bacterium]